METLLKSNSLEEGAKIIKENGVVAFPTETVYGLGANALSDEAVQKIFKAKGRPSDNPLIIHVSSLEMLEKVLGSKIPSVYEKVVSKFWPGPLTILVPKPPVVASSVTGGLDTVAVRMPVHLIARQFIELCGCPLAAPSANISGRPSPTEAIHVFNDLSGKIPLIIDGGPCQSGLESTVLDCLGEVPVILRPGGVTLEMLKEVLPKVLVYKQDYFNPSLEMVPTTPGMKYKHYSPNAEVVVVLPQPEQDTLIKQEYEKLTKDGKEVGVLRLGSHSNEFKHFYSLGSNASDAAKSLFAGLREMENEKVDVIIVQGLSVDNEGLAVMNRLLKASNRVISNLH